MSNSPQKPTRSEWCDRCDDDTDHQVSIEIVTESEKRRNAKFSREPYRVSECVVCGDRMKLRMNNA
jgi:hypothetical protein